MELEAYIPSHRTLSFPGNSLENFHIELTLIVDNGNTCAVHKTDTGALSETGKSQEHGQGYETTGHDLYKTVV